MQLKLHIMRQLRRLGMRTYDKITLYVCVYSLIGVFHCVENIFYTVYQVGTDGLPLI